MTEAGMLNMTIRDNLASPPRRIVRRPTTIASADGAVPGLLNQVMGVRISPEAPLSGFGEMDIIFVFETKVMGSIPVSPANALVVQR